MIDSSTNVEQVEERQISERGRALMLAAAVLDRPNADPDDNISVLARQLTRAQEEIEGLNRYIKYLWNIRR